MNNNSPFENLHQMVMNLVEQVTGKQRFVMTPRLFIDLLDRDHNAAILLSRIIYWSQRASHPEGWFYKSYAEWYEETGFSEYQVHRVIYGDPRVKTPRRTLRDFGVEVKTKRAPGGSPTKHYRINVNALLVAIGDFLGVKFEQKVGPEAVDSAPAEETMLALETLQRGATNLQRESNKNQNRFDYPEILSPLAQFQERLGRLSKRIQNALMHYLARFESAQLVAVVERCLEYGARSWAYVLRALENEHRNPPEKPSEALFSDFEQESVELFAEALPEPQNTPQPEMVVEDGQLDQVCFTGAAESPREAWEILRDQFRMQFDSVTYERLFQPVKLIGYEAEAGNFVFAAPSIFWLKQYAFRAERAYRRILSDCTRTEVSIRFVGPQGQTVSEALLPETLPQPSWGV